MRDERRKLFDCIAIVPSLASFFRVIEELSAVVAEGAGGEEMILAESGENFSFAPAEGARFKGYSHAEVLRPDLSARRAE